MAKKQDEGKKPDQYLDVLRELITAPGEGFSIIRRAQYEPDEKTETGFKPTEVASEVAEYIAKKTGGNKRTIEEILPTLWGVEFYQPMIQAALALKTPELKGFVNGKGELDREKVVAFLGAEQAAGEGIGTEAYKLAEGIESAVSDRARKIGDRISAFQKQYQAASQKGYSELTKLEKDSPAYKALEGRLKKMEDSAKEYVSSLGRALEDLQGSETREGIGAREARSIRAVGEEIIGSAVKAGRAKYALGETVAYSEVLGLKRAFEDTKFVAGNMLKEAKAKATKYVSDAISKADSIVQKASQYKAPALAY